MPSVPCGQEQEKALTKSWQTPPLRHGFEKQSLMLNSQLGPWNPGGQVHEWDPIRSLHVAPF